MERASLILLQNYWLTLLKNTGLIEYDYDNSISLAEEIKKMLISSINTEKKNQN